MNAQQYLEHWKQGEERGNQNECPPSESPRTDKQETTGAVLEHRIKYLENEIECACNAIKDSVLCSGNDPATTLHFVNKLKRAARCSKFGAEPCATQTSQPR